MGLERRVLGLGFIEVPEDEQASRTGLSAFCGVELGLHSTYEGCVGFRDITK